MRRKLIGEKPDSAKAPSGRPVPPVPLPSATPTVDTDTDVAPKPADGFEPEQEHAPGQFIASSKKRRSKYPHP